MSLCSNGSEPNPGSPPYVWITWLDAQSWLGAIFAKFGWASLAFPPILAEINAFCSAEPPQPAPLSNADLVAAMTDPIAFERVLTYIRESATWYVWASNCRCKAGPGGTCTYAITQSFTVDHGDPVRAANYLLRWTQNQNATLYGARFYNAIGFSSPKTVVLWNSAPAIIHSEALAATPGWQDFLFATPQALIAGQTYGIQCNTAIHEHYIETGQPNPPNSDANGLPYSQYFEAYSNNPLDYGGTNTRTYPAPLGPIICTGGSPPGAPYPPAPPAVPPITVPDVPKEAGCTIQDVCDLVQRLIALVSQERQLVELVQRQGVPFGYIAGPAHAGLVGRASFGIADLIGVRIQLTTVPAHWGVSADNPSRYIPAPLTLAVGDVYGAQDTHFAHLAGELWFPPAMGAMTKLSYEFRPGCIGTITELVREP